LYTVDNLKSIQNNFDIFCIVTNQQISKTTVFSGLQVDLVWFMVFNATINNISVLLWQSVLLVEETGVPGENH
jgi:hypothetical protein